MTTLLRELIEIPERVHADDFVLRLTQGVAHPEATLRDYVVTPELARNFDDALALIRSALEASSSKAAYLHGSFGSGKSHFMAVLHLLLQQQAAARSLAGLEAVVTKHDAWLKGKRFLLVPYHMIGKESLEEAVLGGYAEHVRDEHPAAPVPAVYRAEGLLADAQSLRERLGDAEFFRALNDATGAGGAESGWGDLAATWDAARLDSAAAAKPGSEERGALIGALVQSFFKSYGQAAGGSREAFVSFDEGLAEISRHAKSLGYDALVLFLDELILWLATRASDRAFLNREGPKVSKLVEAQNANRPAPIVSFIARQRDLRELIGSEGTGAEQLGFADVLQWWEARFDKITLEDRNLPEIASRRLLRPKDTAAREEIDRAYAATENVRAEVFDALLGPHADRASFRKVYPFSPALVETLVAVSSMLQRERTALKVMLHLLVEQRDTLTLGEIVPVGDLFDVIAEGDEAVTEGVRIHFENAKRLYREKLLPMLLADHGLSADQAEAFAHADPKARAFRADVRVLKTLLIASLVRALPVLQGLTGTRLAALNHGSIRTPIEGREGQEVLRRLRRWAARVGEIRIGDGPNPTVAIEPSTVDTDGILAAAESIDNDGNRRRKVRELLFEELGVVERDELQLHHEITWRGTRRSFEIIYGNVRELIDDSLATRGAEAKVVIDFPFDAPGFTPNDDLARLSKFRGSGTQARTLVWIPSFLSDAASRDLGLLVRLDYILTGERFRDYARHLSPMDQGVARALLDNQRSQLRERVRHYLMGAYGVDHPAPGSIDESHTPSEHFQSLDPAFTPQPPVGANLGNAFAHLLGQMLESQFPAHPLFKADARTAVLKKVHEQVERVLQDPEERVPIEKSYRDLMHEIAVPLRLGEMGETHFAIGKQWLAHFDRLAQAPITVGKLRKLTDEPRRMGLPSEVQDLVILVYADQANLAFYRHGGAWPAAIGNLPDEVELRPEELPEPSVWDASRERAATIFGRTTSPLRSAANATSLADALGEEARNGLAECNALWDKLRTLAPEFGISADASRLITAEATLALLRALETRKGKARIEALASASIRSSAEAMGKSLRSAAAVVRAIEGTKWELFEAVRRLEGASREAGLALRARIADALSRDEYVVAVVPTLAQAERDAIALLMPPPPPANVIESDSRNDLDAAGVERTAAELHAKLAADPSLRARLSWDLVKRPK